MACEGRASLQCLHLGSTPTGFLEAWGRVWGDGTREGTPDMLGMDSIVGAPERQALDFKRYSECSREPSDVCEQMSDGARHRSGQIIP